MQLRQTEAVGVLDHHHGCVRNIHAHFDHRGGHENLDLAALKLAHDALFGVGIEPAMEQSDVQIRKNLLAQLPMHLLGRFQFALFVFFDHGIDNVGLMASGNFAAHELPHVSRALVGHRFGDDRSASRRKLVQHRDIEIPVKSKRKRARDGRRGHDQHVRLGICVGTGLCPVRPKARVRPTSFFLHQLQPLHYAEAVLLVHDNQAEVFEFHAILNQRVRSDHKLRVALRNVTPHVALSVQLERAGEQHDAVTGLFQNLPCRKIMLLRQNLGRRHERDLIAVFDSDDRGLESDNRFARADIALQQTPHRVRRLHVGRNLLEYALLRRRRMKGQNLLDRLPRGIVDLERNTGLRFLLAAPQLQPQFDEEQFVENQPDVRRRARRLQIGKAFPGLRPMHLPQSLTRRCQAEMCPHGRRDRIGEIGIQILQGEADNPPKPARRQLALAGGFVDGNNSSDLERCGGLLLRFIGAALFVDVSQNFKLRLHDLQLPIAVGFNFAVERDHLPGLKPALQISGVKPEALQSASALAHRELKNRHAARPKQAGIAHFGDDGSHFAGAQLGNRAGVQAILVAKGQIMKQVVHGLDALSGEHLGQARAYAFHILHRGRRFQHLQGC